MYLNKQDAEKILEIMNKFPSVGNFLLEQEHHGIGSTTTMTFDTTVEDITGKFTVEISGSENW